MISDNHIYDVFGIGQHGAQGIYLDDAASGIVVRGNVIARTHRAILAGGGRDNVIEGNIARECEASIVFDERGLGWMKSSATAPQGELMRRLAEMPVDRPPWSDRYPSLAKLLADDPAARKYNVIRHNIAERCGPPELAPAVVRFGIVQDNEQRN